MKTFPGAILILLSLSLTGLWKTPDIEKRLSRYAIERISLSDFNLTPSQRKLVEKLIEASDVADEIFWRQTWEGAVQLREELKRASEKDPQWLPYYRYYLINYGPFDRLDGFSPFIGSFKKPPGAAFYPEDMTRQEFETYVKAHPEEEELLKSPYTVVKRKGDRLVAVPYHQAYKEPVEKLAGLLKEAAQLCQDKDFREYLLAKAGDLLNDGPPHSYRRSDLLWLKLKGPVELVIGPQEVYEDRLFNYKAAYEAFVYFIDAGETERFRKLAALENEFQANLPVDKKYLAEKLPSLSPLVIADEVYVAGDARAGVQTAAFVLPNDEEVRRDYGTKKVILRNIIRAKFKHTLKPVAEKVLLPEKTAPVSFELFFLHILLHELSHPLGTGFVVGTGEPVGRALKETYSAIEEAKADVLAAYNAIDYLMFKKGMLKKEQLPSFISTYVAGMFRSVRFGAEEAHGKANLIQFNYLLDKGAVSFDPSTGRCYFDQEKFLPVLRDLARQLLEIEGSGDYARAKKFLEKYGKITKQMKKLLAEIQDLPVDLRLEFSINSD